MKTSGSPDGGAVASDGELLAAMARGQATAFSAIVNRHHPAVTRLVWRMTGGHADTEDIVQETFVKLWRNPAQVRDGKALLGWLMRVASNGAIDRMRRKSHAALEAVPEPPDPVALADAGLVRKAAALRVDRVIAGLPERQRLALSLVYFEGLTNIVAADVMQSSVEAVESLLARARRSLKDAMSGEWRELLDALGAGEDQG